MRSNRILIGCILFLSALGFSSCEITGEVPEIDFFLNKVWRLEKVTLGGQPETDVDISLYRLELKDDFTFYEVGIEGAEREGAWELVNNGTILNLNYDDGPPLRFLILDLQIRTLVLRVLQSEEKIGSLDIQYHLEPVKGS